MKSTLGRVAHPSFFLASSTAIVGSPSMTQLHRGMGGKCTAAHTRVGKPWKWIIKASSARGHRGNPLPIMADIRQQ